MIGKMNIVLTVRMNMYFMLDVDVEYVGCRCSLLSGVLDVDVVYVGCRCSLCWM